MPERFGAVPAPSEEELELNRPDGGPDLADSADLRVRVEDDSSRIPINRVAPRGGTLNIDAAGEEPEPAPKKRGAGVFGRVRNLLRRDATPAAEPSLVSEVYEETLESPPESDLRSAPVRRSAAEWMRRDEPGPLADLDRDIEAGTGQSAVPPLEFRLRDTEAPPLPVAAGVPRPLSFREPEAPPLPEKPRTPEETRVSDARAKFVEQNQRFARVCKPLSKKEAAILEGLPNDFRPQAGDTERLMSQNRGEFEAANDRQKQFITALRDQGFTWDRAHELSQLETRKRDYDAAKVAWGRSMETAAYSDLEVKFGPQENWTTEQMDEADRLVKERRSEIARTLIFGEAARLKEQSVEGYPPREKKMMQKALDGYMRLPKPARIVGTSLLLSGILLPFASTGGALFAGGRLVRSLAAATLAQGVGKGIDKLADRGIQGRREKGMAEILDNFTLEKLAEGEKANEALARELARDERKKLIVKGVLMLGAGIGGAVALTSIFEGMGLDLKLNLSGSEPAETAGGRPRAAGASQQASPRASVPRPVPPSEAGRASAPAIAPRSEVPPPADPRGGGGDTATRPTAPETTPNTGASEQPPSPRTAANSETGGAAAGTENKPSLEELATVGKGKGIWHAVYRQLEAQLGQHSPDRFGLSPEDLEDPAKVREVLVRETARILEKKNFVTPDGAEIEVPAGDELWIKSPDAKVFLGPDDQITIAGDTTLKSVQVRPSVVDSQPPSSQAPGVQSPETPEPVVPAGPPEDLIQKGVPPVPPPTPEPTHPPTPENLNRPASAEAAPTPRPGQAGIDRNNAVGQSVSNILEGKAPVQGNNPVGERVSNILGGRSPVQGRNAVGNLLESILGGPDPRLGGGSDVPERPIVPPASPEPLPRPTAPETTPVRPAVPEAPRVPAAEAQATPRPEVRPSLDTLPKGFVEAVPNKDAFIRALDHQLRIHLGEKFTALPDFARQNAEKFIELHARANSGLVGNLDNLSGRSMLDFSRLFEDKVLIGKAIAFGEETRYLGILGFKTEEYLNPTYAFVVRETPVGEYLSHFPKDLGEAVGKTETFVSGDKKIPVKLMAGHIRLADVLRQFPLDDRTKGMTPFEFLRHHGAVK